MIPLEAYLYDWNRHYAELARQAAEAQKAAEAQRQRELEALLQAQAQTRAMILNQAFISTPPPSKMQASIKVINAIDSLKQYLQTIS